MIMKKPSKQRSDEDSKYLEEAFRSIKFFIEMHDELPEDLLLKLYKELRHKLNLRKIIRKKHILIKKIP